MNPARINYKIYQGSTFEEVYRWESATKTYATINTISNSAPCIVTVNSGQPLPPVNWRIRITGVGGMKEINLLNEEDYYLSSGIIGDTISINQVNSANFTAYTTGGIIAWNSPISIANLTAKMQIRENIDAATILELSTANGGIILNPTNYTITVKMTSEQTAAFNFTTAIYSLELTDSTSGKVTTFITGNLSLIREVTR